MRVLAITSLYPAPGRELLATFNRTQFAALARQRDLRVIAPIGWLAAMNGWLRGRLPLGRYVNSDGIQTEHPVYFYTPRMMRRHYGGQYLRSVRPAAERAIAEHRPDVLLSCWAHPDGWAAVRLGREHGLPVVIKVIGSDLLVAVRDPGRRQRIEEALAAAEGVVTVSRDLAGHAVSLGANPERVRVVPEGLDEELFYPGDRRAARQRLGLPAQGAVILFVGNLLWTKGVEVLVDACRRLARGRLPFRCYLVGRGRDAARLRKLVEKYDLKDCVTLAGARPHHDLPDWYRAANLVVLPSYSEGIPNVLREAISCGTPFVASRVGGIPEIAHPSYSWLVPPGDAIALADALAGMLEAPPEVDAGQVRGVNVSCDRSAELLLDCLEDALARPLQQATVV